MRGRDHLSVTRPRGLLAALAQGTAGAACGDISADTDPSAASQGPALADDDGDGVFTGAHPLPLGANESEGRVDGFAAQEDLIDDRVGGASCAPVTDFSGYASRQLDLTEAAATAGVATDDTYGSCASCP